MIDGGIVGGYYGLQAGGRGGSIGEYQGQFTVTSVKARAFDANDYIVFDDGTKLDVYLAPVDIPINSPAPGESMSLWGGLETTITSGVSRSDFDTALARKANAASLANYALKTALQSEVDAINTSLGDYVDESEFAIEKATLDSEITGNLNRIRSNDGDISTLMSAISALQSQVDNLPSGDGDGGTLTADQFLALMPNHLKFTTFELSPPYFDPNNILETYNAEISWIDDAFSDFPVSYARLRINGVFGSVKAIQHSGVDLSVSLTTEQRTALKTHLSSSSKALVEVFFGNLLNGNFLAHTDHTFQTFIPRADVFPTELRTERAGVPLITSASEKLLTNLNGTSFGRTQAQVTDTPSFTDVNLLQNSEVGYESTYLSRFDRIRLKISLLGAANAVLTTTEISFSYAEWAALKALPRAEQDAYQDATIQDNRALVFNWYPDDLPAGWTPFSGSIGSKTQTAVLAWINSLRNADRTIYIGRTNQTNSRLTIAVKGYQGNILGIDAIGYLGAST